MEDPSELGGSVTAICTQRVMSGEYVEDDAGLIAFHICVLYCHGLTVLPRCRCVSFAVYVGFSSSHVDRLLDGNTNDHDSVDSGDPMMMFDQ